ncbi:MAG TPA: small basic protein [Pirellulaceae bacterium]|nr:small basic protein [Pirellulaceae bacterium]HMO93194.1 small basic protein [Pirellulaceae bacterium]HMP70025.1 small basic protein [Pirellulaceae bacterium]
MSVDKSLKIKSGSVKQRNVLKRVERLKQLMDTDRWNEGDSILGMPKVRVQKISLKKKKKVKTEEETASAKKK